jgi:hypothetical protein
LNALAEKIDFLRLKENEVTGAFGLLALLEKIEVIFGKESKSQEAEKMEEGSVLQLLLLFLLLFPFLIIFLLVIKR